MTDAIGPQMRQSDPRGWLVFEWLPTDLQNAEDTTALADHARATEAGIGVFTRPATPTERALLKHLGFDLPNRLTTTVGFVTKGVRLRRWPQLL